ncbi:MAG: hypothetical protein LR011_10575 [Verrucomicrobia bacterium]|nr:hypothetical protein [Verrucomicrobiota bacterium]
MKARGGGKRPGHGFEIVFSGNIHYPLCMRQLVRWILALKPAHPKKGESAFSMVFALLILLVVFRYLPSGFTKSNPFLSLPLFIIILIGALWMTKNWTSN